MFHQSYGLAVSCSLSPAFWVGASITVISNEMPSDNNIVYHCGNVVYDRGTVRLLTEEGVALSA